MSLSNQKYLTQLTLINLHPNDDSQKLYYHPIAVNLDRCFISCNTLNPNPNLGVVGGGGHFTTSPCCFSYNNSEEVKAATLSLSSF